MRITAWGQIGNVVSVMIKFHKNTIHCFHILDTGVLFVRLAHAAQENIAHLAHNPLIHIVLIVPREARVAQANSAVSATGMVVVQMIVFHVRIQGLVTLVIIAGRVTEVGVPQMCVFSVVILLVV